MKKAYETLKPIMILGLLLLGWFLDVVFEYNVCALIFFITIVAYIVVHWKAVCKCYKAMTRTGGSLPPDDDDDGNN